MRSSYGLVFRTYPPARAFRGHPQSFVHPRKVDDELLDAGQHVQIEFRVGRMTAFQQPVCMHQVPHPWIREEKLSCFDPHIARCVHEYEQGSCITRLKNSQLQLRGQFGILPKRFVRISPTSLAYIAAERTEQFTIEGAVKTEIKRSLPVAFGDSSVHHRSSLFRLATQAE